MRKIILIAVAAVSMMQSVQAQEGGKFRVGLDLGYAMPDGGGGVLVALEGKYNVADNMNVGLRYESATMAKASNDGLEASLTASGSISATFDYYFNSGSSSFAPFIGGGIGYNQLGDLSYDLGDFGGLIQDDINADIKVDGMIGGLIRAGFELGKFRVAANYNLIGKTDFGEGGEVNNSYMGISIGFYLGGGKWKK